MSMQHDYQETAEDASIQYLCVLVMYIQVQDCVICLSSPIKTVWDAKDEDAR